MANKIEWELEITPINISTYEASIAATRTETNETDPQNPVIVSVDTYTVPRAKIQTPAQQLAVGQEILAKRQADLNSTATTKAFISGIKTVGKTYLETNDVG